ncbi:unnamed protein product [Lactuca virosa]|uniref:Uncharacterized protein n=1 Tax=Lactuca virosa TaxID=75947 RepID=A0AAU9P0W1_9ASTR|nr:unnamed protein product [Lactuca virosa]
MYPRYNLQTVAGQPLQLATTSCLHVLPSHRRFSFPSLKSLKEMKLVISLTKIPTNINRLRINSLLKKNEIEEPHLKATIKMAIVCKLDE